MSADPKHLPEADRGKAGILPREHCGLWTLQPMIVVHTLGKEVSVHQDRERPRKERGTERRGIFYRGIVSDRLTISRVISDYSMMMEKVSELRKLSVSSPNSVEFERALRIHLLRIERLLQDRFADDFSNAVDSLRN